MFIDENAAEIWRRVRKGEQITNDEAEIALQALFHDGPQDLGDIGGGPRESEPPAVAGGLN